MDLYTCWLTMCLLQPDDTVNVAIEKINSLLENFLGISDTELGKVLITYYHQHWQYKICSV